VKDFVWDKKKSQKLKETRHICFEDIIEILIGEQFLAITKNPSKNFPNQKFYIIEFKNYIYYIPFVEDNKNVYLETIIPSRKALKKYL